ncbi:E3 ubiquitin-protein ligase TRIM39-like, partial [Clarias magur]
SHDPTRLLSEEQLLCSICLDMFTDPVTTPCGHNFCKSCLTQCWETSQHSHCPLCKEKFTKRPELKINTTLREVADHFKKKSVPDKPEVICDACTREKLKALKSCLDYCASFCTSHIEFHRYVQSYKKHKLINPLEIWRTTYARNMRELWSCSVEMISRVSVLHWDEPQESQHCSYRGGEQREE